MFSECMEFLRAGNKVKLLRELSKMLFFEYNIKDTFMVDDGLGTLERKETLYRHTQKVG
jgi:hypothetical protein